MDDWHRTYHGWFELGTVFTMIAGLLNVLAIFDAAAGPVGSSPVPRDDERVKPRRRRGPPDGGHAQDNEPVDAGQQQSTH